MPPESQQPQSSDPRQSAPYTFVSTPTTEMSAKATSSSGTLKWIAGGTVLVMVLAGAYFVLVNKNGVGGVANKISMNKDFTCRDLFSDSDFQEITQKDISNYELVMGDGGVARTGLNLLPGHENERLGDRIDDVRQLTCSYVLKDEIYHIAKELGQTFFSGHFNFIVTSNPKVNIEESYNLGRSYSESGTDIPGLGSAAHYNTYDSASLDILSSNKKFLISTSVDHNIPNRETVSQEIGRKVDASLNSY